MVDLPLGIEPTLVSDQPAVVDHAIGEFMMSLWQAIAIIMAVSIISLGLRPGAIVAVSIPLTLAIVFPIMQAFDIDLQRISLGALIIALSLLVDSAMTTVDVMTTRIAQGDRTEDAASFAYKTLAFPMLTGTFVTAAGFVPIGFAQSAAGEYTFSIFAVVTIALFVSWFVAVLFAPLLGVVLLKPPKAQAPAKPNVVVRVFRALPGRRDAGALDHHRGDAGLLRRRLPGAALRAAAVLPGIRPPRARGRLTLPQNASIYASDTIAGRLDAFLKGDPDVERWSTYVGRGAIRFYLPLDVKLANDFFAQAVVVAKDVAARDRLQAKLEKALAEQMPSVVARVSPLELGPPVGWPVQYRVSGPDLSQVRAIALRLAEVLGGDPHICGGQFRLDGARPPGSRHHRSGSGRLLGLSSRTIAEAINTLMAGTPITQVRDDIYLVPVIARALDEQRSSLSTLRALQLPLPNGRTVPLSQVATFDFKQEYPLIWRRQRVPTLTVLADVPPAVSPAGAVDALAPAIEKLRASLPKDYHIAVGGTVEESANSQASVFAMVPVMLLLMLFFLMAQLHSFSRLFLVVSVIPMGLIGIVFTLLIVGKPLGFVAILGILALIGMIARNAVLLIEQIETERTQRPHAWDAVIEATLSRFRPIMLTAISTVLGFIPIAADVFWGPMAFAIMGGLFVATILTLIVLPALYVALFRIKEPATESRCRRSAGTGGAALKGGSCDETRHGACDPVDRLGDRCSGSTRRAGS